LTRNSRKLQRTPKQQKTENQPGPASNRVDPNPLGLSFVVPTEMVKLPTEGKYYPASSPLCNMEKVEVRHMTAKEEDLLSGLGAEEQDRIFDKLIDSLVMSEDVKASDMHDEDRTAILLAARVTGYGKEYNVNDICMACGSVTKFTFDLEKTEFIEPVLKDVIYNQDMDEFILHLPITGLDVTIKNFKSEDKEFLENERKQKEKYDIEYNYTTSYLKRIIVSVESHTDPKIIERLVNVMPAADAKLLNQVYSGCRPRLSTTQEVSCSACDATVRKEVPVSWAFFRIGH
jgi:hypothetical protein